MLVSAKLRSKDGGARRRKLSGDRPSTCSVRPVNGLRTPMPANRRMAMRYDSTGPLKTTTTDLTSRGHASNERRSPRPCFARRGGELRLGTPAASEGCRNVHAPQRRPVLGPPGFVRRRIVPRKRASTDGCTGGLGEQEPRHAMSLCPRGKEQHQLRKPIR